MPLLKLKNNVKPILKKIVVKIKLMLKKQLAQKTLKKLVVQRKLRHNSCKTQ